MKTILLVEDEELMQDFLVRLLERRGFKVLASNNAETGLKLFKEHNPDCSLLDISLPGMDGTELFQKIKELKPDAKIYFITGSTSYYDKAKELGANGYLTKPVDVEEILKALNAI